MNRHPRPARASNRASWPAAALPAAPVFPVAAARPAARVRRSGFTLLELLVVIAIIGILGGVLLSGIFVAQESAREARTRSLITRLHNQMMDRWESYATRRLPLNVYDRPGGLNDADNDNDHPVNPILGLDFDPIDLVSAKKLRRRQLWYQRQLMRREMPDRYYDLYFQAYLAPDLPLWPFDLEAATFRGAPPPWDSDIPTSRQRLRTSLFWAYHRQIVRVISQLSPPQDPNFDINDEAAVQTALATIRETNQSAECLYLILTTGMTDESFGRNQFFESEVGDTDGDGMLEFVDAWGNPIQFFRWAPGFSSLMQPQRTLVDTPDPNDEYSQYASTQPERDSQNRILTFDPASNYDPFDPLRLDPWPRDDNQAEERAERGYRLIPLIVSLGRDGRLGLDQANDTQTGLNSLTSPLSSDPYADYNSDPMKVQKRGERFTAASQGDPGYDPSDPDTGEFHLDNIHNHDLGVP